MGQRWCKTSRRIHIFLWKGGKTYELDADFFIHKRITSAVKTVEFVNDRMSHIIL
jgi:hypothetical protein